MQERRLKAERTGQMIDLTKDVSPAVLAQTAAKLEAEQKQRDKDDAQRELAEARKPFEARLVSFVLDSIAVLGVPACCLYVHVGPLLARVGLLWAHVGLLPAHVGLLPAYVGLLPARLGLLPAHVGLLLADVWLLPARTELLLAQLRSSKWTALSC